MAARGCLVTGAGRGLGAALALDLLDQGATVVALSRQPTELEQLALRASERGLGPTCCWRRAAPWIRSAPVLPSRSCRSGAVS